MIRTILVDDEQRALTGLKIKLEKLFPELEIAAQTQDPRRAVELINSLNPEIVFLDVKMPVMTGFDVLTSVNEISFETIFVTAYNDYAIEAIRHSAGGYLVKPIDEEELKSAVDKAIENINKKRTTEQNMRLLQHLMSQKQSNRIAVPLQKGIRFIPLKDIIRFSGLDGYTQIHLTGESVLLSSYSLGKFAKMVQDKGFFHCHKSHLINLSHVVGLSHNGMIEMTTGEVPCAKSKKNELLNCINTL